MFRHVVLMTWKQETPAAAIDAVLARLRELPGQVPTIRSYSVGRDERINSGNADLAVVADFDDQEGYRVYAEHPDHLAAIASAIKPILASRVAVQYSTAEA